MAFAPVVDKTKCVGCGDCIDVCPVNVYDLQDGKSVVTNEDDCVGCESCVENCEQQAIEVDKR